MDDAKEDVEILLVEDNPQDAELTMRAFKKHNFANKLVWVKDGQEALDFLYCEGPYAGSGNAIPKLILLDVKLPKIDGLEVLERIKSHPKTKTIPVVMLTSSAEAPDLKSAYALGVNSYMVKPVDFKQFTEAVAQVGMYWMVLNKAPP